MAGVHFDVARSVTMRFVECGQRVLFEGDNSKSHLSLGARKDGDTQDPVTDCVCCQRGEDHSSKSEKCVYLFKVEEGRPHLQEHYY